VTASRTAAFLPFAVAATLLLLIMIAPIVVTLAVLSPREVVSTFAEQPAQAAMITSIAASLCAALLATILGVPAAFGLTHAAPWLRNVVLGALALPLAFPPIASGIMLLGTIGTRTPFGAFLAEHGIRFIDSIAGVALAEFFVAGSFVVITAAASFAAIDPIYEEGARTLGAGPTRVFFHIALPLAAPGILAGMLLAWMRAIGEYGATSIVAYHPASLPIQLYVALSAQGVRAALALAYGFILLAALIVALQWAIRRRMV